MNFTFVTLKYNQPAAARRGEVPRAPVHFSGHFIYQIIKQTDTKNIGKGLYSIHKE